MWRVTVKNTCKGLDKKRVDQYKQKKSKELERETQQSFSVYFLLLFDQELVYSFLIVLCITRIGFRLIMVYLLEIDENWYWWEKNLLQLNKC